MNDTKEAMEIADSSILYTPSRNVRLDNLPPDPTVTFSGGANMELITIPQDKLELYARDYEFYLSNKGLVKCLVGMAFTVFLTIITSDFKDVLFFKGEQWCAIFEVILCVLIVFIFLRIEAVVQYISSSKYFPKEFLPDFPANSIRTPKDFVDFCKNGKS